MQGYVCTLVYGAHGPLIKMIKNQGPVFTFFCIDTENANRKFGVATPKSCKQNARTYAHVEAAAANCL